MARYDKIGIEYDATRKADPYLASRMFHHLNVGTDALYLDIGCGSGNYTNALTRMGLTLIGVDPSDQMLGKAKAKNPDITWMKGSSENIPLEDESVDGVLASLTIHHWEDLEKGFREVHRVLKPGGKLVLFTTYPEQAHNYWLYHYFPDMVQVSGDVMPSESAIQTAFAATGLQIVEQELYFVHPELEDLFLYSGRYDPEIYFREEFRRNISTFSLFMDSAELENGLQMLRADIDSGQFEAVFKRYENEQGDYLFIIAQKP